MFEGREIIKRVNENSRRLDDLPMPEISPDLVSPFLSLPMLRGLWISSVDSNGDWYDISGHGHTLTRNGNPLFNRSSTGLPSFWVLDGTGDYFDRADEADLRILGTEAYVGSDERGLTVGLWLWADALQDWDYAFSKHDGVGVNQRAWALYMDTAANERMRFKVSVDGTAETFVWTDAGLLDINRWHFCVGRFDPSTSLDIYFNGEWWTNTTSIPASIFNSTAPLVVGSYGTGTYNLWDGRVAIVFLCACQCSNAQISSAFQQTRAAFNR